MRYNTLRRHHVYSISTRRKFGMLLVAISVMALVTFLVVFIFHSSWHYVGSGTSGLGQWMDFSGESGVSGYYLIPIFLCGAIGAFCLVWPSRKPPKLTQ